MFTKIMLSFFPGVTEVLITFTFSQAYIGLVAPNDKCTVIMERKMILTKSTLHVL